jgi:hypothetical protein
LGWACVVPAALPGDQEAPRGDGVLAQLESEWNRTVQALEGLRRVEREIAAGQAPPAGLAQQHSEPPRWSLDEASSQLVGLSRSIRELEQELQALRARPPRRPESGALLAPAPLPESGATTGLDPVLRERQAQAKPKAAAGSAPAPLELPDQISLASARAAYLSGDHRNAEAQFLRLPDSPAVRHWLARCSERLGRSAEALQRFDALAADPNAGEYAQRAEQDARFLRWKQGFDQSSPKPATKP